MKSNLNTGAQFVELLDAPLVSKVDANADGNTYFGDADAGTATSANKWRIQRMSPGTDGNTFQYANGTTAFANVWDNRTSLTYS